MARNFRGPETFKSGCNSESLTKVSEELSSHKLPSEAGKFQWTVAVEMFFSQWTDPKLLSAVPLHDRKMMANQSHALWRGTICICIFLAESNIDENNITSW